MQTQYIGLRFHLRGQNPQGVLRQCNIGRWVRGVYVRGLDCTFSRGEGGLCAEELRIKDRTSAGWSFGPVLLKSPARPLACEIRSRMRIVAAGAAAGDGHLELDFNANYWNFEQTGLRAGNSTLVWTLLVRYGRAV